VAAAAAQHNLSEVTLGVRPEAFALAQDGQRGFPLRVDLAEELGADAFVYGTTQLGSGEEQIVVRVDGKVVPHMGDTINLVVVQGNEHVFHPETGARLGD
jgi:multiple sugar transport system ATP-binding protein